MNDLISESFKNILDRLPSAIFWKNQTGQYIDANQSFLKIVGLQTIEQLINKTDVDLPCPKQMSAFLLEADDQLYSKQKDHVSAQKTLPLSNGRKFHLQLHKYSIYDQSGELTGIFGIFSYLKVMQSPEQLYLENIIERIPYYIFWKDKASVYLGCNQRFATLVGKKSPKEVVGKTDYELNWGMGEPELFQQGDDDAMHGYPKVNVEEILIRPDQTKIVMLVSKVPLRDEHDNCIGVLGISTDITERKRMEENLKVAKEEAELSNRVKAEFISNMSHDIRTPLTGIIGMISLIKNNASLPKEVSQNIQMLSRSSEQLLGLLNSVLEVVATDHLDENHVEKKPFDLIQLINGLYDLLLPSTEKKHLKFEKTIFDDVPKFVIGDRFKLERILLNLMGNGIKFTEVGTVSIRVELISNTMDAIVLRFTVKDTGIGIEKVMLPKIFDQFFRGTGTYKGKYEGHGIGLYVTKKFIDLLGGKIEIKSEVNQGSTFCFDLPLLTVSDTTQILFETPSHLSESTTAIEIEKPKLLLVEDNHIAAYVAQNLLVSAGFEVDLAEDGESALKTAKQNAFDLIVTDIGLPGISGNEWVAAYRHWEWMTGRSTTMILGLTAHADNQIKEDCLAAGMNEVLTKPLGMEKAKALYLQASANQVKVNIPTKINLGFELPETEAALFQLAQYPLFDEALSLKTLSTIDILQQMIVLLIEKDLPEALKKLQQASRISDWQQIQEIVHKLKGSALYCETTRLKYACQSLERYLLAGYAVKQEALLQQLIDVMQETTNYLSDWLIQIKNQKIV